MQENNQLVKCVTCGYNCEEVSDDGIHYPQRVIAELWSESIFTILPNTCKQCIVKKQAFAKCGCCGENLDNDLVISPTPFNLTSYSHYIMLNAIHYQKANGPQLYILEKNVKFDAYCMNCYDNMPHLKLSFKPNDSFYYNINMIKDESILQKLGYKLSSKKSLIRTGKTMRHNGITYVCEKHYDKGYSYCSGCQTHRCREAFLKKNSKHKKKMELYNEFFMKR